MKPFKGMGRRVTSSLHLHVYFYQTTTEFPSGNLYNVQAFILSEKAEKQQRPALAFISLDRGEIHSYVGSKESQAFDTVQLCLQRKAPAAPDDRGVDPGLFRQCWKSRCPRAESSTGNQKAYP